MHTFTRPGSTVRIHVNSDWSGDVIVTDDRWPAIKLELPALNLLSGNLGEYELKGSLPLESIFYAVSIAAEWFTRRSIQDALDDAVDSAQSIDELVVERTQKAP